MADENKDLTVNIVTPVVTPAAETPAVQPGRKILLPQIHIAKVDVSHSTVDPLLYMKREMLLYQEYSSLELTSKVFDFFHASYAFRSFFASETSDRSSFVVYPTGASLMSRSPDEDLKIEHDTITNKVTTIYTMLFNVTPEEWIAILASDEYLKFKAAKDSVVDVLGWKISDYRVATAYSDMIEIDKITFNGAAALWNASKAV